MSICDLLKLFDERFELGKYSLQGVLLGVSCKSHDITEQNTDLVIETRWKPAPVFELTGNRPGQYSRKNLVGALSLLFDILVMSRFLSPVMGLLDTLVDARLQNDRIERLGQIIGRAEFDATDDALDVLNRRDHQDWNIAQFGVGAHLLQHFIAVDVGHHDIEENKVHRLRAHLLQRFAPVCRHDELGISAALETHRERNAIVLDIVHQENCMFKGRKPPRSFSPALQTLLREQKLPHVLK